MILKISADEGEREREREKKNERIECEQLTKCKQANRNFSLIELENSLEELFLIVYLHR